jgi:hypothetical protein
MRIQLCSAVLLYTHELLSAPLTLAFAQQEKKKILLQYTQLQLVLLATKRLLHNMDCYQDPSI